MIVSDATIWSVTFYDTSSVNYDRNMFIIQATGVFDPRHFQSFTIFLGWAKAYLSRAFYIVSHYRNALELLDLP